MAEEKFKGRICIMLGVVCIINAVAILCLLKAAEGMAVGIAYSSSGPFSSPEISTEAFHGLDAIFTCFFVGPLAIIGIGLIIMGVIYVRRSRRKA